MEMSMNVIIVAVIALIILAILLYFLGGTSTDIKKGLDCAKKGGRCIDQGAKCEGTKISADCGSGNVCCALIPGTG